MAKYYTKDGKEFKGSTHKDASGKVMSGKTHTKTSKYLFTLKELEKGKKKTIYTGNAKHTIKKDKKGHVIVEHPNISVGKYDKINLTKMAGAKTIKEGEKATKKWHKKNPHPKKK